VATGTAPFVPAKFTSVVNVCALNPVDVATQNTKPTTHADFNDANDLATVASWRPTEVGIVILVSIVRIPFTVCNQEFGIAISQAISFDANPHAEGR
jgi:ABC-type antimicrobial peptide transport system permease subunit